MLDSVKKFSTSRLQLSQVGFCSKNAHTEQCRGVPMHSEQFQTSVFLDYWHTLGGQNYFAGKSSINQ